MPLYTGWPTIKGFLSKRTIFIFQFLLLSLLLDFKQEMDYPIAFPR